VSLGCFVDSLNRFVESTKQLDEMSERFVESRNWPIEMTGRFVDSTKRPIGTTSARSRSTGARDAA